MVKIRKFFRCIKNYFLCKKYPFWKITASWYLYNFPVSDKNSEPKKFFEVYKYTWYDDICTGWQKAFGKELSKEIKIAGKKYLKENPDKTWKDILSFQQIKEKYGELCLYASAIDPIMDILNKYEYLSLGYCQWCGKPARYVTKGWISFLCESCFEHSVKTLPLTGEITKEELEKIKQNCRLTKKDIPKLYRYDGDKNIQVDFKTEFGIDFEKLWGLK